MTVFHPLSNASLGGIHAFLLRANYVPERARLGPAPPLRRDKLINYNPFSHRSRRLTPCKLLVERNLRVPLRYPDETRNSTFTGYAQNLLSRL